MYVTTASRNIIKLMVAVNGHIHVVKQLRGKRMDTKLMFIAITMTREALGTISFNDLMARTAVDHMRTKWSRSNRI